MGLFDMFGAGGGTLGIQAQSAHVSAGAQLAGQVGFQSGTRSQRITSITLKLVLEETRLEATPQGPQNRSHTRDVVPPVTVTGAFATTPGQTHTFPFNLSIPPGLPNTTPNVAKYRLVAAADIDGEIDPGANVEITVVGGAAPAMPGGMMPGGMMPGMAAGAMMGGMAPGMMAPGMMAPGMMPPGAPMPLQIGTPVVAQWQDGQWHPGRVVALQNGMVGVDWDNPALGQSSWLAPPQVQPAPGAMMPGAMGAPPAMKQVDPYAAKQAHDPYAKQPHDPYDAKQAHDPYAKQAHDPYAKQAHDPYAAKHAHDPYAAKQAHDPYAKQAHDPYAAKQAHDPYAKGGGVAIGTPVIAQAPDGQWHPGHVVALQNGMIGVDWENPALGASSWVQPHQVRSR